MSKEALVDFRSLPLWGERGDTSRPVLIAGPCSAESREQVLETAQSLSRHGVGIFRAGIWKPRTYPGQFEGMGEEALPWLLEARERTGLLIGTEVGSARHVELSLKYGLDYIWIGARSTSSPFAVQEIADALRGTDITVLIKNPLTPSLDLWKGALLRLLAVGCQKVGLIHRGFDIGAPSQLRNAPLWEVIAQMREEVPGVPIYLDPSHIAGKRQFLRRLVGMAGLLQYDGLMMESHTDPAHALSDKDQQVTPDELASIVADQSDPDQKQLLVLREEMEWIDDRLMLMLNLRRKLSKQIGDVKQVQGFAPYQEKQYQENLNRLSRMAEAYEMPQKFVTELYRHIHHDSVELQSDLSDDRMSSATLATKEQCITLNKVRFFGYHGLLPHEKRVGNSFEVTLRLYFPASDVMQTGDLILGINYAEVYEVLKAEMAIATELLEVLTQRILERLKAEFPILTSAHIAVTKLHPPIGGYDGAGVTFSASADYR